MHSRRTQLETPHAEGANPGPVTEPSPPGKCPAAYRPLSHAYVSHLVSDWAEWRQCASSGHNALYARVAAPGCAVLHPFTPRALLDHPTYLTIQVDEDQHIELVPEWLQHINHSCDANVLFDTRERKLIALRDIQPGDELCCFYPATEWVMDSPFVCRCGASRCLGFVSGASQLDRQQLVGYRLTDFVARKLQGRDTSSGTAGGGHEAATVPSSTSTAAD